MNRHYLRLLGLVIVWGLSVTSCEAADRLNIIWISCEDISPNLGCYGDADAITPNLDQLASQGARFDQAFTPAGVCAVVRSGIITGIYPPSLGSQHMRSRIIPPPEVKAFPELLRAAGYFTTNRSKTDYQFEPTASIWDRQGSKHQDWRERSDPKQPFFSVINLTISHESKARQNDEAHARVQQLIGKANVHDPETMGDTLPPYLPNTAAARKNWAKYHDNITRMDQQAGEVLQRLEEDGLTDDTIVVFWSDHGMGLPRGKRWVYDTGTLVPMIVRWPGEIAPGSVREDLVTMIDLPPTMLSLAGVEVPDYMQGRVVLGDQIAREPAYLFFHRDRMDEVYELQRAARDRRWKYIRNYEPEKPYSQRLDYMDEMPAMQDWRRWAAADRLSGGQKNWFQVPKPIEELYDTEKDPWELTNLADQPQYTERLKRMRDATEAWQDSINDLGLVPEAVMMEEMIPGGERPRTEAPVIRRQGGQLSIECATEGASIVYRRGGSDHWQLFTRAVPDPGGQIQAMACRLGYRDSRYAESQ
ncbi:MAG: sulfatase [Planctomycetota bacterium]